MHEPSTQRQARMPAPTGARAVPPYPDVRKRARSIAVRREQVPVGHEVSHPLPTLRWRMPAFACFAAPAVRRPGTPLRIGAPDRWWLISASDLGLAAYALTRALPFTDEPHHGATTVTPTGRSEHEAAADLEALDELMTEAVPAFFDNRGTNPALRADLESVLAAVVAPELLRTCRLLVPDFFSWLAGGPVDHH
jgi:hypothetical protein